MDQLELADRFDAQRPRLLGIAYRILGSLTEAEDAVQETWLRLQGRDVAAIENLEARLGKPVTSSNHALAWHSLRLGGFSNAIGGYGRLMRI